MSQEPTEICHCIPCARLKAQGLPPNPGISLHPDMHLTADDYPPSASERRETELERQKQAAWERRPPPQPVRKTKGQPVKLSDKTRAKWKDGEREEQNTLHLIDAFNHLIEAGASPQFAMLRVIGAVLDVGHRGLEQLDENLIKPIEEELDGLEKRIPLCRHVRGRQDVSRGQFRSEGLGLVLQQRYDIGARDNR